MHNSAVQESQLIQTVLVYALPVLFAITLHEAAHGYAARYLGDPTAWQLGRVTLNPWAHVDLVGTLLMPVLLYLATSGAFLFGYAKPVPVNFSALKHPRLDMVRVAAAGPAMNVVLAFVSVLLIRTLGAFEGDTAALVGNLLDIHAGQTIGLVVETHCNYFAPLAFPQTVQAGIRVASIGSSSVRYEIGLFAQGEDLCAAKGHFIHVYVDRQSRRPLPLPTHFLTVLKALA